jgi:hypothetical protein
VSELSSGARTAPWRNPVVVLAALCVGVLSIVSMKYVQGRFDRSDEHNAELIVRNYRGPMHRTLEEVVHAQSPAPAWSAVAWRTETLSSFFQHIRVHAELTGPAGARRDYEFDVDLNTTSIHPGNPLGESALQAMGEPRRR